MIFPFFPVGIDVPQRLGLENEAGTWTLGLKVDFRTSKIVQVATKALAELYAGYVSIKRSNVK
jgi:hypothetical protein